MRWSALQTGSDAGFTSACVIAGLLLAATASVTGYAQAPVPPTAPAEVEARFTRRIEEARAELALLHEKQATEREALVRQLATLRTAVREIDGKVDSVEWRAASARDRLSTAQRNADRTDSLAVFAAALLSEYRRALETRIGASERQAHEGAFRAADQALAKDHPQARLAAGPELLRLSARLLDERWGARESSGQALDREGNVIDGKFLEVGPVAYFRADSGEPTGIVSHRLGSPLPTVLADAGGKEAELSMEKLDETGEVVVPIDVTLGSAVKLAETRESWIEHVRKGGVTMVPLLLLATVCAILAVWKALSLFALRGISADRTACESRVRGVVNALSGGRTAEATALAAALPAPVGPVIEEGVRHHEASAETVEEVMSERLLAQVPRLERFLTPLAVCATAAPLLGLLGTVTGMIHTFRLITVFGTGDARLLSSGISEALITTEFGLLIAIPALLIHAWLSRRVRDIVAATQQAAILFVNALKLADGQTGSERSTKEGS
jgi:biopolymer transport protein ExbB